MRGEYVPDICKIVKPSQVHANGIYSIRKYLTKFRERVVKNSVVFEIKVLLFLFGLKMKPSRENIFCDW